MHTTCTNHHWIREVYTDGYTSYTLLIRIAGHGNGIKWDGNKVFVLLTLVVEAFETDATMLD